MRDQYQLNEQKAALRKVAARLFSFRVLDAAKSILVVALMSVRSSCARRLKSRLEGAGRNGNFRGSLTSSMQGAATLCFYLCLKPKPNGYNGAS